MQSNKLASLPLRITSWPRLEKLNLAGNQLTAIPDSIGQLRALRDLNLEGNKLESLPEALGALPSLSSLNLNGNPPSCRVGSSATLATLWYRCGEGEQASPVPVSDIGKRTASVLEALREVRPSG